MNKSLVFMLMLMLAASPLSAAPGDFKENQDKDKKEKKDKKDKEVEKDTGDKASASDDRRPAGREIRRDAEQVSYDKSRMIQKKYGKGDDVIRFTPVIIGGLKMRDFSRGTVIGMLDIDRKGEGTGLPAGKYHVYVKQIRGDWATFYEKDGNIVKDAVGVHFYEEGQREPKFKDDGECVLYSHWEFCY
jgi:hypothetical protein